MNTEEIYDNNAKAKAILDSLKYALTHDVDAGEEIVILDLVDAALDYLKRNNQLLSTGL